MNDKPVIGIVGSGNLSWHLCKWFTSAGLHVYVHSRNHAAVKEISTQCSITEVHSIEELCYLSDLLFLCVQDNAIGDIAEKVSGDPVLLHCSGAVSLNALDPFQGKKGVWYPLQSFVKYRTLDYAAIPVLIESAEKETLSSLHDFTRILGNRYRELSSAKRLELHLAAVFANNFTNYMLRKAYDICVARDVDPSYLLPLVKETFARMETDHPRDTQTGPAVRNDQETLDRHKELMDDPEDRKLYELISKAIQHDH